MAKSVAGYSTQKRLNHAIFTSGSMAPAVRKVLLLFSEWIARHVCILTCTAYTHLRAHMRSLVCLMACIALWAYIICAHMLLGLAPCCAYSLMAVSTHGDSTEFLNGQSWPPSVKGCVPCGAVRHGGMRRSAAQYSAVA